MPPPINRKADLPEWSMPYMNFVKVESPADIFEKLVKQSELKPRPTFLKVGVLSEASVLGSAYLEYGDTKIMAAVLPPREITKQMKKCPLGIIECSLKYLPFASQERGQNTAKKAEIFSLALKKAMEPVICRHEFQNFQIEIFAYVLEDDGCVLSSAINCCGAALIEGGIPIYDIISASTVSICKNRVFNNPNNVEEQLACGGWGDDDDKEHGTIVIASLATMNQITECLQKGYMTYETVEMLTNQALTINHEILKTLKHVLTKNVKKKHME